MRRIVLATLTSLAFVACDKEVVTQLSQCQRQEGANEAYLTKAKADQAAAEQKATALEERLKAAQEELEGARRAPEAAAAAGTDAAGKKRGKRGPGDSEFAPEAAVGPLRVGVLLPSEREERWIKDKLTMLGEAKKKGIELLVQLSENAAKQTEEADILIAQGVRVLILTAHDAQGATAIIDKATKAGIQVICYDRLVLDSPHDYYYLSFDGVKVGAMQGEFITRKVPRGTYIVLAGSPTDNNAKLFRQGAMRFIQPLVDKGEIKVAMNEFVPDWSPTEAQKLCTQALAAAGGKVDAVLAPNDGTAGGCIQALAARGLAGKVPITGQDGDLAAAIRIIQGTQSMTVFKDTRLLGKKAIEMAADLLVGKPIETRGRTIFNNKRQIPAVLLAPYVVTRENLDEQLIKSGYLNREAVYRK